MVATPDPFLRDLGINVTTDDVQYVFLSIATAAQDPITVIDRLRHLPLLLDRTIPDTELARRRVSRFLQGLEIISRAVRVLLTIDDMDLLGEIKAAVVESIREAIPEGERPPDDWSDNLTNSLSRHLERLQSRLRGASNPSIQTAINVLSHGGELLDPKEPLPRIVLADTIDFAVFRPESDTSRGKSPNHRRK